MSNGTQPASAEHDRPIASEPQAEGHDNAGEAQAGAVHTALLSGGASDPNDAPAGLARMDSVAREQAVMRMQAQRGNRAVARVIARRLSVQRQPTDPSVTPGLDASMLHVNITAKPAPSGTVTTSIQGSGEQGRLTATSPLIRFTASVTLDPKVNLGGSDLIKVGPVQTLMSTERTGIYKKDGKVVAELSQVHGMVRDARPLKYAEDKDKKEVFAAEPPFYDRPKDLSDTMPSATVEFMDQPTMALPLEFGGGKLAAIRGADKFNTSVGAKRAGLIITMNPFGWQVDWTTELKDDYSIATDEKGNPLAKGISTWAEEKGIALNTEEWAKLALKDQPWVMKFTSVEAAMTESALSLLLGLLAAREADPASAAFMAEALKKKNAAFSIAVRLNRSIDRGIVWEEDAVSVFAHLHKQSDTQGPVTIANGQSHTWSIAFNDIADPASINMNTIMSVWAGGGTKKKPILGEFAEFPYPFSGAKTIQPSDAEYKTGEYLITVGFGG